MTSYKHYLLIENEELNIYIDDQDFNMVTYCTSNKIQRVNYKIFKNIENEIVVDWAQDKTKNNAVIIKNSKRFWRALNSICIFLTAYFLGFLTLYFIIFFNRK